MPTDRPTTTSTVKRTTRPIRVLPSVAQSQARHLGRLAALLLLLALALSACGVRFSDNPDSPGDGSSVSVTPGTGACPVENTSIRGAYTPQQLRTAYGVETLCQQGYTGKGQTVVVIVSFGSPSLQQDVDTFSQRFGLPKITLDIRAPLGAKPFDPSNTDMTGWQGETTLDVEMIHSMAPDAQIVVLTSPVSETEGVQGLPEFRQLEQYAVNNHLGNVVNQSWAASEATLGDSAGQAEIAQWNTFYQQATTQQGMTFFGASGDSGATDYCDLKATQTCTFQTTSFPTDNPWVVSVGGTSLHISGAKVSESVWNSNGGASGGGFSKFYAEPSYQQMLPASVQSELNNRRGVPDVAADGDPSTALAIYVAGKWVPIGGTSAASPLWAGIMAVANQMAGHPLGFINPALYSIGTSDKYAQDFRDVTSGNNSASHVQGFSAAPGWDPTTGLGAPIADKLLPDLIATVAAQPTPQPSPSPQSSPTASPSP